MSIYYKNNTYFWKKNDNNKDLSEDDRMLTDQEIFLMRKAFEQTRKWQKNRIKAKKARLANKKRMAIVKMKAKRN